jgi:hypothetical protein
MTSSWQKPDLAAIVRETEAEMEVSEAVEHAASDALGTAELGYYEAELGSLRDAAERLEEAERPAG